MHTTTEQKQALADAANRKVWAGRIGEKYFWSHDTFIAMGGDHFNEETSLALFVDICNFLLRLEFKVNADPYYRKQYPILSKYHRYARRGDLECKFERYPVGVKLDFYQNLRFENPHGGYYDFNKLQRMPYLVRLRFLHTRRALFQWLTDRGHENHCDAEPELAIDRIQKRIQNSGHWDGSGLLERVPDSAYAHADRDKRRIVPGQKKYFYDWNKRLSCGIVYYNLNNMWWVHTGQYDFRNVANFELFDFDPAMPRRRKLSASDRHKRLSSEKRRAVEREDYARAAQLRDLEHALPAI
jgi:hypothetical protein